MSGKQQIITIVTLALLMAIFMTFTTAFAGTTTYQYDELDRLIKATYSDGTVIEYAYDEIGNRIQMAAYKPPVADFSATPATGYFPLTVNFSDLTAGNPTAWLWDFGDGFTSTDKNPAHIYNSQGNYTVALTASNFLGTNSKTKTSYITVQAGTTYKVKIASATPTYYNSLQAAYTAAADGATIQCQAVDLTESLSFNLSKTVTLVGGYNPEFTLSSGITTVYGTMNITAGVVSAKSFNLRY